jgi:endonuclease YncB( thermonuclease family)
MGSITEFPKGRRPRRARTSNSAHAKGSPRGGTRLWAVAAVLAAAAALAWLTNPQPFAAIVATLSEPAATQTVVAGEPRGTRTGIDGGARPASASFAMCKWGGGYNCVVDGDTFYFEGEKIRIADIDAPETHPPRCDEEARLGDQATDTLLVLLNAGPFTLSRIDDGRDIDRYGRKLRIIMRDGASIGAILVARGLARTWTGARRPWCT